MKHIYKFFLALLVISAAISCSKDDSPENTPTNTNGGDIFAMQVVTINLPGTNLSQEEYIGTLGGRETKLIRNNGTLVFTVSPVANIGQADLVVPNLNLTIHYNIKENQLSDTADNTMADLFESLNTYSELVSVPQIPEDETSLGLISALETIYNDASPEEKEAIAKFYNVNKTQIDLIMSQSITGMAGRFNFTAAAEVAHDLFVASLQGLVLGVAGIIAADYLVAHPVLFAAVKTIGAIIGGVALGLVVRSLLDFYDAKSAAENVSVGGIYGENDRNTNDNVLNLVHDRSYTTAISTYRRTVNITDGDQPIGLFASFFEGYNTYISTIQKINLAIEYVNSKVPFTIPSITMRYIPSESTASAEVVNTEIFNQLSFSVSHPNLQLITAELASDGQLQLKVKVVGEPASLPIESTLNYSYNDSFSDFSGTIPLKVEVENPLVGTWTMVSFDNGVPVGDSVSTYSDTCPNILAYKEFESGSFTFTTTGFSYVWNNIIVMPHISYNPETCEVYGDNPDTSSTDSETGDGTYSFNGTSYILNYSGSDEQNTVQFITEDRIKIYDQEFVRN